MVINIVQQITSLITESLLISVLISFILGFLVGYLIKKGIEIGLILLAIITILIGIGILSPSMIIHEVESLGIYINQAKPFIEHILHTFPYNSIVFIIGLIVGLLK